jgi:hypothetical protein
MLTDRQIKAIPVIIAAHTYKQGYEQADVSQTQFYEWLKQPEFKTELERQRNEVVAGAFGMLSQSLTKAVETLTALLDTSDGRLRRLAANDVIGHILKHKEIAELAERLEALEQNILDRQ